jgi:hypothetical protein
MTNHVTEQELLEHALGTIDDEGGRRVSRHCDECVSCKEAYLVVVSSIDRIRSCEVVVDVPLPDLMQVLKKADARSALAGDANARPLRKRMLGMVRFAAVLCAGIGIGYAAAVMMHQPSQSVIRQQFVSRTIHAQGAVFLSCRVDGLMRR